MNDPVRTLVGPTLALLGWILLVAPSPTVAHGSGGGGHGSLQVVVPDGEEANQPSKAIEQVETVHVVVMTHLDVGFTDSAVGVINTYFSDFFPAVVDYAQAIAQSKDLKLREFGYVFTSHPWLLEIYLDCASAKIPGLACPTVAAVEEMHQAIAAGIITWQGNTFNLQASLLDPRLYRASLGAAHELDRRFGLAPKRTVSLRDVPGSSRAVSAAMGAEGYRALSIGANGAVVAAAVPNAFLWQTEGDAEGIVGILHPGGYGGVKVQDCIVVAGLADALCVWVTGDNSGPPNTSAVFQVQRILGAAFPHAKIVASTFDAFVDQLWPLRDRLPVVTQEMGDTWIGGPPADPWKIAAFRMMSRERSRCLDEGLCQPDDPALRWFDRMLLKAPEHTAGLSSTPLMAPYGEDWSNAQFEAVRDEPGFQEVEASWDEQRAFLFWGLEHLEDPAASPGARELGRRIRTGLAGLRPGEPSTAGLRWVLPTGSFDCGRLTLELDPDHGSLADLRPTGGPGGVGVRDWATRVGSLLDRPVSDTEIRRDLDRVLRADDIELALPDELPAEVETVVSAKRGAGSHPMGLFAYRTYDSLDFWLYIRQYAYVWPLPIDALSLAAFDKPGVWTARPRSRWWLPRLSGVWERPDTPGCDLLVQLTMDRQAHEDYGAPFRLWVRYRVPPDQMEVEIDLVWVDKTPTRLPESAWMIFRPRVDDPDGWRLHVLGEEIDPRETLINGSRHLAAVWDGVSYRGPDGSLTIDTFDASVLSPGRPSLVDFNNDSVEPDQGMWFNLSNNVWNTNWPLWYPWRADDANARFRFRLTLGEPGPERK